LVTLCYVNCHTEASSIGGIYIVINFYFHTGPVLAFAQTIHMTASFLSPIAAGIILQESVSLKLLCVFLFQTYFS
jgi:hypothetical protein